MLSCALQAPQTRIAPKPCQRAPQLIGLGLVLRVVDDDIVAAGKLQRILAGARLGARTPVGDDKHAHVPPERGIRQRGLRLIVHALDNEDDLQTVARIVEAVERAQQMRHYRRLPEKRHQHGVEGQRTIAALLRRVVGGGRRGAEQMPQGDDAQSHHQQEGDCHDRKQRNQRGFRRHGRADAGRHNEAGKRAFLPKWQPGRGRQLRRARRQTRNGLMQPVGTGQQIGEQGGRRGADCAWAHRRPGRNAGTLHEKPLPPEV